MVNTPEVSVLIRPEKKVRHVMYHSSSQTLAWCEGPQDVFIATLTEENGLIPRATYSHEHTVNCLVFHRDTLVVGDEIDGLSVLELDGTVRERFDLDGGVQQCIAWKAQLVGIGGLGQVFVFNVGHPPFDFSAAHALSECVTLTVHGSHLYLVLEGGEVMMLDEDGVRWRRPTRGDHGERITAIGTTSGGLFFLTREGHALVPGDEEAIEFECWKDGNLVLREEQRMRLLTSAPSSQGALLGYDDGRVFRLDEGGDLKQVMETGHPVFACIEHSNHVVASSWFFIHGVSNGTAWKVEHQGMPSLLALVEQHGLVVFAGDDQNDYTAPEPIGVVTLNGEFEEVDEAELGLWFEPPNSSPPVSAEALYGDAEDLLEHLTEAERATFTDSPLPSSDHDLLIEAMGATSMQETTSSGEPSSPSNEDLHEALNDFEALTLENTDALLDTLQEEHTGVFRPQADAGDDQRTIADEDGTAIVHLDGRRTNDPHSMIVNWSWLNERGEELAASSQVKLRLPLGLHVFELRVVDNEGSSTTDSVRVHVLKASTS